MIKVLIVDDHEIFREGIKKVLGNSNGITISGESADGRDACKKVAAGSYDVVLLDLNLPGMDGLDVLKEIRRMKPHLPVLILSMYPEDKYAVRILKAGAFGYLSKSSISNELITAVKKIQQGKKYISTALAETIADSFDRDAEKPLHVDLSDREFQVLKLIAQGNTVGQISESLCLGITTISTYRSRILDKMGMKNNAELTRYALKQELVD